MNNIVLRDCPFCGRAPRAFSFKFDNRYRSFIRCDTCKFEREIYGTDEKVSEKISIEGNAYWWNGGFLKPKDLPVARDENVKFFNAAEAVQFALDNGTHTESFVLFEDYDKAVTSLKNAGYTDLGGQLWKPPLGKNPLPELDKLRAENEQLREALKPFIHDISTITPQDLYNARKVLLKL